MDNTTLNTGTGGDVIATDDIAGVKVQRVKVQYGTDGAATDVSDTNPMPVDDAGGSLTVDGTVTANAGTNLNTSLLALESGGNLAAAVTALQIIDNFISGARGLVTEDNSAAIKTAVELLDNTVSGSELQVDVVTMPAVTGTVSISGSVDTELPSAETPADNLTNATAAPRVNALGYVFDGSTWDRLPGNSTDGALVNLGANNDVTVTGTVTANAGTNLNTSALALESGGNIAGIRTAVEIIDNAISGSEMQVDVVTMPAITGTVSISGAVDTELPAAETPADDLTNATAAPRVNSLGYVFDGTAWDRHPGNSTDGALVNLGTNNDVTVTGTVTANAGTNLNTSLLALESGGNLAGILADTANIETAVQLIDDTVKVLGTDTYAEATTKGLVIGAVRRDADTTAVGTDNEVAPLVVNATGYLKVEAFSGETLPVSLSSTTITSGSVTADTELPAAETPADNLTNATAAPRVNALGYVFDGSTWDRALGNSTDGTLVNLGTNNDVTVTGTVSANLNAGTNYVGKVRLTDGTLDSTLTDETTVDVLGVGGGTAHDAVNTGNPVQLGGHAVSGSASPTSVAAADRTRWIFNQHGIPYVMGGHPNLIVREFDFGTAAQTDLNLASAVVAADERCYVVGFEAMCDNANSVAVSVRAGFGTANVPTASATGVSGMIATHPGVAAGSGFVLGNGSGLIAVGAAGEEPRLTSSAATSGNLHVIIRYFIIDETP